MAYYCFQELENIANKASWTLINELALELDKASLSINPSHPLYERRKDTFSIQNMIGTVGLKGGSLVEILPKTGAHSWMPAVTGLLGSKTRFHVTTTNCSSEGNVESTLTEAIAQEYANRLQRALSKSGPMLTYEHIYCASTKLTGRLNLSKWIVRRITDPAHFNIDKEELAHDNVFTRAMDIVAEGMSLANISAETKLALLRTRKELRPDCPKALLLDRSTVDRQFPEQWQAYKPAWDIASAIIRGKGYNYGSTGSSFGIELAIEPWPLLEALLELCMQWICDKTSYSDSYESQKTKRLFIEANRTVKPDGVLYRNGRVLACLDAKYKTNTLSRNDLYQALATAAAFKSPISILVYPDNSPMQYYRTITEGCPKTVATVGIDLFSFSKTADLESHASGIIEAIKLASTLE